MKTVLVIFLSIYVFSGFCQNDLSDSLARAYAENTSWNDKAETAYEYAKMNLMKNPDNCLVFFKDLENHSAEITNKEQLFNNFNCQGIIYQFRHSLDTADVYFDRSKVIADNLQDTTLQIKYLLNKGLNYRNRSDYDKSISMSLRALEFYKAQKDTGGIGRACAEIGNGYYLLENWTLGEEYQLQALAAFKAMSDANGKGNTYASLSYQYEDQDELDIAIAYLDSAIIEHKLSGNIFSIAKSTSRKCSFLSKQGASAETCLDCYTKQLQLELEIKDLQGEMICYQNISNQLNNMGKFHESIVELNKALRISKILKETRVRVNSYKSMAYRYNNISNYRLAYKYMDSAYQFQDSLRGADVQGKIIDLDKKYQTAEKDRLILEEKSKSEIAEKKEAIAERDASNKSKWLFALGGGTLTMLFLGMFLFQKRKRKAQAEKDEAVIQERDKGLNAVIDAQENERKRISKDLHDGIGQQLSGLKMAWGNVASLIKNSNPEEHQSLLELTKILDDSASEVRSISHQMMPRALQEMGLAPAIEDMLEKTFKYSEVKHHFDDFSQQQRFNERIEIGLYRICQELINNCVKHSGATEVNIQLLKNEKTVTLIVEDNGIGLRNETTKGHGLLNISSRLSAVKGNVSYENGEPKGTIARIRVPLNS